MTQAKDLIIYIDRLLTESEKPAPNKILADLVSAAPDLVSFQMQVSGGDEARNSIRKLLESFHIKQSGGLGRQMIFGCKKADLIKFREYLSTQ
jgi:hypothetical protein